MILERPIGSLTHLLLFLSSYPDHAYELWTVVWPKAKTSPNLEPRLSHSIRPGPPAAGVKNADTPVSGMKRVVADIEVDMGKGTRTGPRHVLAVLIMIPLS